MTCMYNLFVIGDSNQINKLFGKTSSWITSKYNFLKIKHNSQACTIHDYRKYKFLCVIYIYIMHKSHALVQLWGGKGRGGESMMSSIWIRDITILIAICVHVMQSDHT